MLNPRRYTLHLGLVMPLVVAAAGCMNRPVEKPWNNPSGEVTIRMPLTTEKDVDILFVVDNSLSMADEQAKLARQFPKLIDALRSPKLGPVKAGAVCNESNTSGCKIANVRIGVVSSDMGAGNYGVCAGNDRGQLQYKAKVGNCQPPRDRWISYNEGATNIFGAGKDPIEKVKEAFSCIAQLGTSGCGFEQPMEAAMQALHPQLNRNPGFLRNDPTSGKDALLAVVFITDEDDCSARIPTIFDRMNPEFDASIDLSFRCFLDGVSCAGCSGTNCAALGDRTQCKPKQGKYLYGVNRYIDFFKKLKASQYAGSGYGRVLMAAIAGPTNRVKVVPGSSGKGLAKECQVSGDGDSGAVPAVRIQALVHAFSAQLTETEINAIKAKKAQGSYWIDEKGAFREENYTSICSSDFSPALRALGKRIVASLVPPCLRVPAISYNDGVFCKKGDVLFQNPKTGKKTVCQKSCLNKADFVVKMGTPGNLAMVQRCPDSLFNPAIPTSQCGEQCGCWRVVPNSKMCPTTTDSGATSSPYAVEIMRKTDPPKNTILEVKYLASPAPWGTADFADLPQCV